MTVKSNFTSVIISSEFIYVKHDIQFECRVFVFYKLDLIVQFEPAFSKTSVLRVLGHNSFTIEKLNSNTNLYIGTLSMKCRIV